MPSHVSVQVDTVETTHAVGQAEYSVDLPPLSSPLDMSPLERLNSKGTARHTERTDYDFGSRSAP